MTQLVSVALYHRDSYSEGHRRRVFRHDAYHWGITIMPEYSQGRDCHAYEATDASEIDPVRLRLNNPSMDWWYRFREYINPALSSKLLGRIVIGRVPDRLSVEDLRAFFGQIPLPIKNQHPQQSCVTWVVNAIWATQG